MKVCIFGAGAIGTHMAARLGHLAESSGAFELSVVARGAQAEALASRGARVMGNGGDIVGRPARVTDDAAQLPPQDIVLVTLKGTALPPLAATLDRLTARDGVLVFAQNGIPWWWNVGLPGSQAGKPLPLLDPSADLMHRLADRALGCVISSSNELREPGLVFNGSGRHLALGEPDGSASARLARVRDLVAAAGFAAETSGDLRTDIWSKLAFNIAANPISALTRLVMSDWLALPDLQKLAVGMVDEMLSVAKGLGWDFGDTLKAQSLFGASGSQRTRGNTIRSSMLQDVLRGKPLEIDPILGQPVAFADELGIPVPHLRHVLGLLRGLDMGLRKGT